MKNNILSLILLICLFAVVSSCKKEAGVKPADNDAWSITTYKGQIGNPSDDALQAQLLNTSKGYTINVYGSFNATNDPLSAKSVTFHRQGNDTVVYLGMNIQTKKLETAYTVVNGIKQPYVIKHTYFGNNDSAVQISIYYYNWSTNTGELIYDATYQTSFGHTTSNLNYLKSGFSDFLVGIGSGIAIAEIAFYGTSVSLLGAAGGAVVVAAAGTLLAVAAAAVIVVGGVAILSSSASANAEPITGPLPSGTIINNPVINPVGNLPPSPCVGVSITYNATMDQFGAIAISNVQGGQPGYQYSVSNSAFQQSQIFNGPYLAGSYLIMIKDNNSCVKSEIRLVEPNSLPLVSPTSSATAITTNSAIIGGNITFGGSSTVTSRGICYSTSPNPTTMNSTVLAGSGTGTFSATLTGLTINTTYYASSFATNSSGTVYGQQVQFKTLSTRDLLFRSGWQVVSATSDYKSGTVVRSQTINPYYEEYSVCNSQFYTTYSFYNNGTGGWTVFNGFQLRFIFDVSSGTSYSRLSNCSVSNTSSLGAAPLLFGQYIPGDYNEVTKTVAMNADNSLKVLQISPTSATVEINRYPWQNNTQVTEKIILQLKY